MHAGEDRVDDVARMYWTPSTITVASVVNRPMMELAVNSTTTEMAMPYATVIAVAYLSVRTARSGLPAPMFCADIAETVASMEDGTRNSMLITFSTTPTAAASLRPR